MNKKELLDKIAKTQEDRIFLSHIADLINNADNHSVVTHSGFLSPAEINSVSDLCEAVGFNNVDFIGGYADAERKRCIFLPDWAEKSNIAQSDYISALRLTWYEKHSLSHRDILGTLMGLGLRRDSLGDILIDVGSCDILVLPEIADFIASSLEYAKHEKLHIKPLELSNLHFPEIKTKQIKGTVMSLRLDAVASVGFNLSRSKIADYIHSDKVMVNHRVVNHSDFILNNDDTISCRGLGKCKLADVGTLSRKGRINITVLKYI